MSPEAGALLLSDITPRLASAIPYAVPFIASEDADEVLQDGVAMAAKIMHNIELAGKRIVRSFGGNRGKEVTAGNVAYFTIIKLRSGRRSTGSTVADVHGAGTQINGRTRLTSLDEVAASEEESGGEIFEFHDVLTDDQEDPGTKAARRMDWDAFMAGLSDRDQAIVKCLVEGRTLASLGRKKGVTSSTLRLNRLSLAKRVAEFMGFDILADVQRRPQWRQNLDAIRESVACRVERRHV